MTKINIPRTIFFARRYAKVGRGGLSFITDLADSAPGSVNSCRVARSQVVVGLSFHPDDASSSAIGHESHGSFVPSGSLTDTRCWESGVAAGPAVGALAAASPVASTGWEAAIRAVTSAGGGVAEALADSVRGPLVLP